MATWRSMLVNAKNEWEQTTNACGSSDVIIWSAPINADTGIAALPDCGQPDTANVVGFADMGGWTSQGLVLGRTCSWWNDYIYESDVTLNTNSSVPWCDGARAGCWDLQSVAAHEFGHALGLGHVETGATPQTATAIMHPITYQNDVRNRSLSRGDIDGARALYPRGWSFQVVSAHVDNPAIGARLEPSHMYTATITVENTGYYGWVAGDTAGLVALTAPAGRCSGFVAADWPSCSFPSAIDESSDGEPQVLQGQTAQLRFQIPVGWNREGTSMIERFRVHGFGLPDQPITLAIDTGTYKASVVGVTQPGIIAGTVLRGVSSMGRVRVRNDGTAPWFPQDGRMQLVTSSDGRCSKLAASDWASCRVASAIDAPSSTVVLPGEVAEFDLNFYAPIDTRTNIYTAVERFDVAVLGRPGARLGAISTFRFDVY